MVIAYTFITCINHHPRNCPFYIHIFKEMNRIIVKSRIHQITSVRKLEETSFLRI